MSDDKITPAQLRELAASKWSTQGQMQDALVQAAERIEQAEAQNVDTTTQAIEVITGMIEDINFWNRRGLNLTSTGIDSATSFVKRAGRIIGEVAE